MSEKIYMGGVCGMGMAPLAAFLKSDGAEVFGFDDTPNADVAEMLDACGVDMRKAFEGENFDKFVISSALKSRGVDFHKKYPSAELLRRGEMWARICATRKLTAVVGSHGKSTVSAMLAYAGLKRGEKFGYLIGAVPRDFSMQQYCRRGEILVSEIDESDGTIELFSPDVCVALNADLDHVDTYADEKRLREMFARLFSRTKRAIVYPENDGILSDVAKLAKAKGVPVKTGGNFKQNDTAMASAAFAETFNAECAVDTFDDFNGLARRQEILADTPSIFAASDYAHHPHEVEAFLTWLDTRRPERKTVIFQPHRYTRTKYFKSLFARILEDCAARGNEVLLMPVYPASEPYDADGSSGRIAQEAKHVRFASADEVCKILRKRAELGEKIEAVFVGAGDFHFRFCKLVKEILKGKIL